MSTSVHVDLGERSYNIAIGEALDFKTLACPPVGMQALVVTDTNVGPAHGDRCEAILRERGVRVDRSTVPAGESSKSMTRLAGLYDDALEAGLDRQAVIIALGGGMVGDLAGYMAATYLRGVKLIQVPTSLLAMVDSSVGGKTAVNLERGKNLVGVFYQPREVVIDLGTLETLPDREYRSGLAEVIKYGVIWDASLFHSLESHVDALLARDVSYLEEVIARCCEIKAEVVAIDERDAGVRAILNFGHTLGHAMEQVTSYGTYLHGEAVAVGMVYSASLSIGEKDFPEADHGRLVALLKAVGLPVAATEEGLPGRWDMLRKAMQADKKTVASIPRFVLAERLGSVLYGCEVAEETLKRTFEEGAELCQP